MLRLAGLDDAASRTILADLLGTGTGATIRGDALLRNANGNPLFLEKEGPGARMLRLCQ